MPAPEGAAKDGVTVLIPAHNEALTIRAIAEGALAHADHVLVISDGSTDATVAVLDGLPVEVIVHRDNLGKGQRLVEGLGHAVRQGAAGVLVVDADGQHDPADIPAFLAAWAADPEALILGQRVYGREAVPRSRAASVAFGDFFIGWGAGQRLRDAQCGMRLYPGTLMDKIELSEREIRHFSFETAVLMHAGLAGVEIRRVPIAARYAGYVQRPSHYRPLRDTLRIVIVVGTFLIRHRFRPRGLLIALGLLR